MSKCVVVGIVTLSLVSFGFAAPGVAAEQDAKTGSIKGKISVSGVRSPENVLVYLEKVPGEYPAPKEPVEMDQKKLVFVPHVLPIVKGTTVKYLNSDPVLHNVMWPASKDGAYPGHNLGTWGKGASKRFTYAKEGHLVILCNVHPEMEAHVLVLQNPFAAVVGKEGTYEIKDVPPGKYTVKTWYPNARRLKSKSAEATVEAGKSAELNFSLSRR